MRVMRQERELALATNVWSVGVWRRRGVILLLLDILVIAAAYTHAYYIRFFVQDLTVTNVPVARFLPYFSNACMLAVMWTFLNWRDGEYDYDLTGVAAPMIRLRSLVGNGTYATVFMIVVSYLYHGPDFSRQVYVMTVPMAIVAMSVLRHVLRRIDIRVSARYGSVERIVVVGTDPQALEFARRLQDMGASYGVRGVMTWKPVAAGQTANPSAPYGAPYLGCLAELEAAHTRTPFTTLVLSLHGQEGEGAHSPREIMKVVNFCEEHGIRLYSLPSYFDVSIAQNEVGSLSGMPLVRLRDAHEKPAYAAMKRSIDVFAAGGVILLGMPVWLVIAALIRRDGGPVFFTQTRAGLNGRPFTMYKFRSMVVDAEQQLTKLVDLDRLDEPVFKLRNDPRITPLGRFMRRSGIDEIPQLWNVLRGEMSIVGPRPEELRMVHRYNVWQLRRLKAKPGITGFQQITCRGDTSLSERLKCDLIYMKHQGLLFDLYIMLRTILVVLRGEGRH